jgi:hypothetical protein
MELPEFIYRKIKEEDGFVICDPPLDSKNVVVSCPRYVETLLKRIHEASDDDGYNYNYESRKKTTISKEDFYSFFKDIVPKDGICKACASCGYSDVKWEYEKIMDQLYYVYTNTNYVYTSGRIDRYRDRYRCLPCAYFFRWGKTINEIISYEDFQDLEYESYPKLMRRRNEEKRNV